MPRNHLDRKKYKIKSFKGWVRAQMHVCHKTQKEVGEALGLSQSAVSKMLAVPKNEKEKKEKGIKDDPFSYGQVLALCEFFGVDGEEKKRLLTM